MSDDTPTFEKTVAEVIDDDPFDAPVVDTEAVSADAPGDSMTFDTTTVDVEVPEGVPQQVHDQVYDRIQDAERRGYDPDCVVVGVPQYRALLVVAAQMADGRAGLTRPESLFPVDLIVVPGPMIYVPTDNMRTFLEHNDE
jgi:hypothetical protein